jgi:hypothetical protein
VGGTGRGLQGVSWLNNCSSPLCLSAFQAYPSHSARLTLELERNPLDNLNDLDVSADYTDRLIEETLANLPQVFLERELGSVREELENSRSKKT